jgi:hypothetical protein
MRWPSLSDYNEAIQNPQTAFDDVELKSGKPELNQLLIPRARTGRFACVYKVQCGQRNWAVRCFSQETTDQQERYAAISHHLRGLNLPYLVAFDYLNKGIRVGGRWYPILKMEWVQGDSIVTYVARNSANHSALAQLASRWAMMIETLQRGGIAHGDLQHGNILVESGDFKLVDYDGMYVPALMGRRSNELGEPNYQHPKRNALDYGPYLDNFSAWAIYLAIVALATDTKLRSRITPDDEFLLFRKEDFDLSRPSTLLRDLEKSSNPKLQVLAIYFRSLLYSEPKQIPALNAVPLAATPEVGSSVAPSPDWVSDHIVATAKSAKSTKIDASSARPDASWVLDLVSSPKPRRKFNGRMTVPRVFGLVSLVVALISSVILFQAIASLVTGLSNLETASIFLLIDVTLASFTLLINLAFLAWSYERDATFREKKELVSKEKEVLKASAQINGEISAKEKSKLSLQKQLERQRNELDSMLMQLHSREQAEQNRIVSDSSSPLSLLKGHLADLNRREQNDLSQLKSTLGIRINSLDVQLRNLAQEEVHEIADEVRKTEAQYINNELRKHRIEEAPLFPGTQYTSQSALITNLLDAGITTAYDISSTRVDAVSQFGPKRTAALVNWQNNLEQTARQQMPAYLTNNVRRDTQKKYIDRRHSLENERRLLEAEYTDKERACLDQRLEEKLRLQKEIAAAQEQVDCKVKDIAVKYAPRYAEVGAKVMALTVESGKRSTDNDRRIGVLRQQLIAQNWEFGKTRHELNDYRNISLSKYFQAVWFGRR